MGITLGISCVVTISEQSLLIFSLVALFAFIATALISKHVGPEAYTAYSLTSVFLGLTDSLISGIASAETTLTAQAIGMDNPFLAGQYAQMTVLLYLFVAIPSYGAWIFLADIVVLAMDLGEEVANIIRNYIVIAVFSYL